MILAPTINIKLLHEKAQQPHYASVGAAGGDVYAVHSAIIAPQSQVTIATGIALELPEGWEAQVRSRSGLAFKHGVAVLNSPGTIDADYRGELKVVLYNHSDKAFTVEEGTRIAQLVFAPAPQVPMTIVTGISQTERGQEGFGSTGSF